MSSRSELFELNADLFKKGQLNKSEFYGFVAERIKCCLLDPEEAKLIASWFERLAKGESPKSIFSSKGGRPKGSTSRRKPMANGQIPDDYDIAWLVRRRKVLENISWDNAYTAVGHTFGLDKDNVKAIHNKCRSDLSDDPILKND